MSDEPAVRVFFWGSHINREVVAEANLVPGRCQGARAAGFEIVISHAPISNARRGRSSTVL
jgi:hypothetical protein